MHLCTNYMTLGLCRASLLRYYTTTATQLAADSALSKWCRVHRPPFSDPNTLDINYQHPRCLHQLQVSYYFVCMNAEHSLCSTAGGILGRYSIRFQRFQPPLVFAQYTSLDPSVQCLSPWLFYPSVHGLWGLYFPPPHRAQTLSLITLTNTKFLLRVSKSISRNKNYPELHWTPSL